MLTKIQTFKRLEPVIDPKLIVLAKNLVDSVVSKPLAAPFVTQLGPWIVVQWMRSKMRNNFDAKIPKSLETENKKKNKRQLKKSLTAKPDSDVIDHAINSRSKVP